MQRKVEGLENLNNILTLPIGSKFGMFEISSIRTHTRVLCESCMKVT